MISYQQLRGALDNQPLFEDKTWRLSPFAWPVNSQQFDQIQAIGKACWEFYKAVEILYLRSLEGKNLLRNRPLKTPWVVDYLDRGKPEGLIEHTRSRRLRGLTPNVIRPDLLLTSDGFALTEIDSVPGGIGLTAFLNRLYDSDKEQGNSSVIGSDDAMIRAFYATMLSLRPEVDDPLIVILVSDEAATYRPEMDWLALELRKLGKRVFCRHPSEVIPLGDTLCLALDGNPVQIDIVYRFWELFDLANVKAAEYILEAWDESTLAVSPPMKHIQEEKMNLALFHHHLLDDFWRENLSRKSYRLLHKLIPKSWIMDGADLPPTAVLDGPEIGGKALHCWQDLGEASQKERNLIIKISGFHESAWGARSVILGSDSSRKEWLEGIEQALSLSSTHLHILQEYRKPARLSHTVFIPPQFHKPGQAELNGDPVYEMEGRLRLCPYYFIGESGPELCGILATFCPADKKIIHGMKDAALMPCALVE